MASTYLPPPSGQHQPSTDRPVIVPEVPKYSPAKTWRTSKYPVRQILRAVALAYMGGAFLQYNLTPGNDSTRRQLRAGGLEYLTLLGFMGTQLTLLVSILCEHYHELVTIKAFLCSVFVAIEGMIALLYWSLYFVDPNLILDHYTYKRSGPPPFFMDTSAHAIPFFYLFAEFFYSRASLSRVRQQRSLHIIFISCFSIFYNVWIHHLFSEDGAFPYPFLQMIGQECRTAFAMIGTAIGVYLYGVFFSGFSRFHKQVDGSMVAEDDDWNEPPMSENEEL